MLLFFSPIRLLGWSGVDTKSYTKFWSQGSQWLLSWIDLNGKFLSIHYFIKSEKNICNNSKSKLMKFCNEWKEKFHRKICSSIKLVSNLTNENCIFMILLWFLDVFKIVVFYILDLVINVILSCYFYHFYVYSLNLML